MHKTIELFAFDPARLATGKLARLVDFNPRKEVRGKPGKTGKVDSMCLHGAFLRAGAEAIA